VDNVALYGCALSEDEVANLMETMTFLTATPYLAPRPQPCVDPDSDGDGLTDYEEFSRYKTNPNDPDTDGDGILDSDETYEPVGRRR